MVFIVTFLGKGGIGCTTTAIATARKYASLSKKVLLVVQDSTPSVSLMMGVEVKSTITEISSNFDAIQLQTSQLLENSWEELKKLEAKYLRSPILNNIFAQELALLPGMDDALALNYLREQEQTGKYDVIVYDGKSSLNTLRMFGIPETLSWYIRRVKNLLENSDIIKALSPFVQPVTSAVLNVSWSSDNFADEPTNEANQILDQGKNAINNPGKVAAFLITNSTPESIATARYWWGSAQQIGLTVGGVLLNQREITPEIENAFNLLTINSIPDISSTNLGELSSALPDFQKQALKAPSPLTIDTNNKEVKIFLPGFDKKQVKLSQSGPEITISAGDQRRNILLPPPLKGQSVKGAKFQDAYLVVSL
ncbi:ArsA family ATPase [Geminocystis sp. NIES-3709]|uniref:Get3/ArsA fold putative tail anchor-mediating ATPase NosAFP n=1 Tax=Geminocystis sp. NIES-3709 TaxID=1617448 RepID=UPI0005FC4E39|nr:ArsA family ATPase [Geminocystis sp. NIES-3709]BAQ66658.1 arsenical pump-driving ATPase [Geminocystis sp. NIES-3709]